jgi:7-keto-8-aminopelargonate synthetase-like enzyme
VHQVSLFEKCRQFTKAREIQAAGLYPYFKPISESEDTVVIIEGQRRIMLGSNNYLGLTHHPKVLEAAQKALHQYGSGCTGSRFLNGTLDLHETLEHNPADFLGKEACLIFSTGYQANLGLISGLIGRGDVVVLDKLDHASIVDGAKMSYGETERFNHGDLGGLERKLERERDKAGRGTMIVVDGVYSMEGDIADVPNLVRIAHKHGAALAIDDAHSLGVLGPKGQGTAAHFGMTDEVDIIGGTFSKSLASIGGFVASSDSVIHYLRHHCRPLIFTASLPPANTAGVIAALECCGASPSAAEPLGQHPAPACGFRQLGFDIGPSETPSSPCLSGRWRRPSSCGGNSSTPASSPIRWRHRQSRLAVPPSYQRDGDAYLRPDRLRLEQFGRIGRELGVI